MRAWSIVNVVSQNYILYHQPKPSKPKKKAEQVCWIPSTFHPGWRLVRTFFTNSERDMGPGGKCWSHHGPVVRAERECLYTCIPVGKEVSLIRSRPKVKSLLVINHCLVYMCTVYFYLVYDLRCCWENSPTLIYRCTFSLFNVHHCFCNLFYFKIY